MKFIVCWKNSRTGVEGRLSTAFEESEAKTACARLQKFLGDDIPCRIESEDEALRRNEAEVVEWLLEAGFVEEELPSPDMRLFLDPQALQERIS